MEWSSQAQVPFGEIRPISTKLLAIEKVREMEGSDHLHKFCKGVNTKVHNMSSIFIKQFNCVELPLRTASLPLC
jgi:hypothetical protein